ncbi:MAG TPA: response regulator transcription factor [Bacteroidia bacterium]|jgi:two-component system invasion response regulator UvrY|nr:response regulator transcription factor [Bacteroidia bacterium]
MKILIADDHELIRDGLATVLVEEFPSVVIKEVSDGKEAEKFGSAEDWDIIIMDMSMPERTGLDVLKQLRLRSIKTPVLICSIHPENQYAFRVLKAGGNGYISKDCPRAEFISAIKNIINGKKYISASLSEKLALKLDDDMSKEEHELISDRELEVLKLIASGKTVSQIADKLMLSVTTISTYRHRLLEKMNLKNNAELTCYAINNNLV